ncbi:hypothetical protein [uncultured Thiodictyon sp.]|uniref:hypothetical protein n=1 Tax=uncultured Thiodictyon sp. TaxID=1846217 RepID=UPI0025D6861F|nr:hypothetical protein [uncultured Thiodictyon sp.]
MLEQIAWHVERRDSFAFETTLSGFGYARKIPEWQAFAYHIKLFFLSLPSPELALERIAEAQRR